MPLDLERINQLFRDIKEGREGAKDELLAVIYDELHAVACRIFQGRVHPGGIGNTLQPTVLFNEAFLRLIKEEHQFDSLGQLFAVFNKRISDVLSEYFRKRLAGKNGGRCTHVPLDVEHGVTEQDEARPRLVEVWRADPEDIVTGEEQRRWKLVVALRRLAASNVRTFNVATMRLVWNYKNEEIAALLGVCIATVEREWKLARAWLTGAMRRIEYDD